MQYATPTTPAPLTYYLKMGLLLVSVLSASFWVGVANLSTLEHTRQFTRAMHYHILKHTSFDIYWTGPSALNYPIQEYYTLSQLDAMLGDFLTYLRQFDNQVYGAVTPLVAHSLTLVTRQGTVQDYPWTIAEGFTAPFQLGNITSLRRTFTTIHRLTIDVEQFVVEEHVWNMRLVFQPFAQTSVVVRLYVNETIDLSLSHVSAMVLVVLLIGVVVYEGSAALSNILIYFLVVLQFYSSMMCFSGQFRFQVILMVDGVVCLTGWLSVAFILNKDKDYHLAKLLLQSYRKLGRVFLSFLPLLMAFCLLGYCLFCRYTQQFSSFWHTFTRVFFICYYNMTYEAMVVTSRSSLSLVFFMALVLIFTMCIYSGMLVAVFCSYVWSKRELLIERDIMDALHIVCEQCGHKYKYQQRSEHNAVREWGQVVGEGREFVESAAGRVRFLAQIVKEITEGSSEVYWGDVGRKRYEEQYRQMCWEKKKKSEDIGNSIRI